MKAMRLIAIAFIALAACAEQTQVPFDPQTEEEKKLYAVGLSVAGNTLGTFKAEFTAEEVAMSPVTLTLHRDSEAPSTRVASHSRCVPRRRLPGRRTSRRGRRPPPPSWLPSMFCWGRRSCVRLTRRLPASLPGTPSSGPSWSQPRERSSASWSAPLWMSRASR